MPISKSVYQLKVTLNHSKPPIWRRFLVSEGVTLYELHEIIQGVMGWTNSHLHEFTIAGQSYGDPEDDELGNRGRKSETRYRLNQLDLREKSNFSYEYDFGDSWEHIVLIEKILPSEPGIHYPVCATGKRACPPEDVGGIWGYAKFLEAIADPDHEEHDDLLGWAGGDFDPDEFDLDEINEALKSIKSKRGRRKAQRESEPENYFEDGLIIFSAEEQKAKQEALMNWVQNLDQEQLAAFESLPLRRDVLTFLDYLSRNRTVGTQATGNLPLKAVQEICANFVHPPKLKETVGEHLYKLRSEDDVFSLLFVHQLAFNARLISGGQSRVWKVTSEGQMFSQLPAPVQSFLLFIIWWTDIDWTIAFPVSGLADGLPVDFKSTALNCLQELPLGENAPFEPFADRLIAQSRLTWPSMDQTNAHSTMRFVVEQLVVEILEMFGVLECEYVTDTSKGYELVQLKHIRLTTIGKGLLDLMK